MHKTVTVVPALLLAILAMPAGADTEAAAENGAAVPVIEEVAGARMPGIRQGGFGRNKPQTFETVEDLTNATGEKAAERILAQVDLMRQYLVLFQWSGSGQDKLSFRVDQTEEAMKVVFKYRPGLTRDLRPHAHLYAIRKGVPWEIGPKARPRFPGRKRNKSSPT